MTGAAGFIGSHLAKRLAHSGYSVIGLVRPSSDLWRFHKVESTIDFVSVNIDEIPVQDLARRFEGTDVIYHLAASGVRVDSNENPFDLVRFNVLGTLKMLEVARYLQVEKFIYCGSCFEYPEGHNLTEDLLPNPISEYAASKTAGWFLAKAYHLRYALPIVALRPFTVYGPFEAPHRLIPYTILKSLKGETLELSGGDQERDFVYIDDVIDAFLLAGTVPDAIGETLNICSGEPETVKGVVATIRGIMGEVSEAKFGFRQQRDNEMWKLSGSFSRAKRILKWEPNRSLRDGLEQTINWFRDQKSQYPIYGKQS